MDKILLKEYLKSFQSLLIDLSTPELKAVRLKELLKDLKNNQTFDLISGVRKGSTEMFQEYNKKELTEEIEIAIMLLDHFESTSTFGLVNIPLNKYSMDVTEKFNEIKSLLVWLVENK